MYVVLSGTLSVHLEHLADEPVANVAFGGCVGELALLDGRRACAFVAATEPAEVLVVREAMFWELIDLSHSFAVNLLLNLAQRIRVNNRMVTESNRERARFEQAALFDGLTGIHNRRWFDDTLTRVVRRAAYDRTTLSVALLDIDHFKRFNDDYGHAAGDRVLQTVAKTLSTDLRPTDLVARFGGEEFVVILPGTDHVGACVALNRLREAVARTTVDCGETLPQVTISVGIATATPDEEPSQLVARADAAMYRAKQAGRNRVVGSD